MGSSVSMRKTVIALVRDKALHGEVLGGKKLTAQERGNDMRAAIEEEEFGDLEGLDKHDGTSGHHGHQGDDVDGADDIEDNVAWASQSSLEKRHGVVVEASKKG